MCNHNVIENKFHYDDKAYRNKETYFPGEPFKKNEYEGGKIIPKEVCTPSIRGDASQLSPFLSLTLTVLTLIQILVN